MLEDLFWNAGCSSYLPEGVKKGFAKAIVAPERMARFTRKQRYRWG